MRERIYVIGYPGDYGGACTETWHTIKLWRKHGIEVTCIPTWKVDERWRSRLDAIGCQTLILDPKAPRLPVGSLIVSFCNHAFLHSLGRCRTDYRIVWVPCMTYICDADRTCHSRVGPFDAYVFQSHFQRRLLWPEYRAMGAELCWGIPGAFDVTEFPFCPKPHMPGLAFIVGRLSRSDPRKFAADTWEIYGGIPNVRARVMGWSAIVGGKLGKPPKWAECLPKGAEKSLDFLRSLHAVVHAGGEAVENWPRFVLEAMAAGVPIVTDDSGGTPEMIEHGHTGYLCRTSEQITRWACDLAWHDGARLEMARKARAAVMYGLADPQTTWLGWQGLFAELMG